MVLQPADLGLGQHPPVAHQDHAREAEAVLQLGDLIGDGGGIAAVARIDLDRHRAALRAGQDAVDHLGLALLAVPIVAEAHQGTGPALVIAAGHVVEGRPTVCEMAPGQLLLDLRLALQEPVHGLIEVVLVGAFHPQLLRQAGGVPQPGGGELGAGMDQALEDHGQDQVALG